MKGELHRSNNRLSGGLRHLVPTFLLMGGEGGGDGERIAVTMFYIDRRGLSYRIDGPANYQIAQIE